MLDAIMQRRETKERNEKLRTDLRHLCKEAEDASKECLSYLEKHDVPQETLMAIYGFAYEIVLWGPKRGFIDKEDCETWVKDAQTECGKTVDSLSILTKMDLDREIENIQRALVVYRSSVKPRMQK